MKKNVKLFSSVEALKALREQARLDIVMGFYGRHGRRVAIRKAGRAAGQAAGKQAAGRHAGGASGKDKHEQVL